MQKHIYVLYTYIILCMCVYYTAYKYNIYDVILYNRYNVTSSSVPKLLKDILQKKKIVYTKYNNHKINQKTIILLSIPYNDTK